MMRCRTCRLWMEEFATDGVDPAREAEFRAHLDGCVECRAEWQAVAEVDDLLGAVLPVSAPAATLEAIRRGVQDQLDEPVRAVWWPRVTAWAGAVALLLLVFVAMRQPRANTSRSIEMAALPATPAPSAAPSPRAAQPAPAERTAPAPQPKRAAAPPRTDQAPAAPRPPAAAPTPAPLARTVRPAAAPRTTRSHSQPAPLERRSPPTEVHVASLPLDSPVRIASRAPASPALRAAAATTVVALAAPVVRAESNSSFTLEADDDAPPVAAKPAERRSRNKGESEIDELRVEPAVLAARVVPADAAEMRTNSR